jgi:hypothetical protein
MKALIPALIVLLLGGCARFQPRAPATNYGLTATQQSFTLKDTSVHYNPDVLKVGTPRSQVVAAFGEPNGARKTDSGQLEDIYAFYPDGTKFVDPQVRPRNVAMAVFSMGTSVAVRQARLRMAEKKLTMYHVFYGPRDTVENVQVEKMSEAPEQGPAPLTRRASGAGRC